MQINLLNMKEKGNQPAATSVSVDARVEGSWRRDKEIHPGESFGVRCCDGLLVIYKYLTNLSKAI